jgi:hypothetical protein
MGEAGGKAHQLAAVVRVAKGRCARSIIMGLKEALLRSRHGARWVRDNAV